MFSAVKKGTMMNSQEGEGVERGFLVSLLRLAWPFDCDLKAS